MLGGHQSRTFTFPKRIFGPLAIARRVLYNRICPSVRPSFCPGIFLGLYYEFFMNFCMVLETCMKLCVRFCSKRWENGPNRQGFLNLLKDLVINFYWICSIMKTYIICCVPAQIPSLRKFLFLRYGPKCSQPIRLQDFLINHISRTNQ